MELVPRGNLFYKLGVTHYIFNYLTGFFSKREADETVSGL